MAQNKDTKKAGRGRPGAMTMAMQAVAVKSTGPKVLRIGLIQDGKIVEERVIRRRETVSVGTSEKNQFIVQAPGLASRFELFQLVGNDYILNFTENMGGKVGLPGGGVQELEQLRKSGAARNAGSHFQVKLGDSSRGKVVMGNVTLLFQFVVPPPITPRPQLPAAARGGFVKGIDWLFTAFVVFSYMTFFGFVIYLENADWEIESPISAVPDMMARLVFQEPPPPEQPTEVEPVETDEGDEPEEVADNSTRTSTSTSESSSSSESSTNVNTNAEARARVAEQAMASAESLLLGALGSDGALSDVLAGGAVTGNADEILAQAAGVGVATRGSGDLRERGGGGNGSGEGNGLGTLAAGMNAGMAAMTTTVMEREVRGSIRLQGGGDTGGSGDFDANLVVQQIRRRLRAIQRCYETELRRNPSLEGKVTVQFTIVERGTISAASATENTTGSPAVATCVVNTIRRFRFNPGPEGGSVNFSYPFVFAPQN